MVFDEKNMNPLFEKMEGCKCLKQLPEYHPEKDVFSHLVQTMRWAFRESDDVDLILAAMLHDVGKQVNPLGHAKIAVEILEGQVTLKTLWLIENHMKIWHYVLGDMKKLQKCKGFGNHPWLPELVQLARWDKLGRNPCAKTIYDKKDIIDRLNKSADKHWKVIE